MIAKIMMIIIMVCSKFCISSEQLLPWEAQGGLLGTVLQPSAPYHEKIA